MFLWSLRPTKHMRRSIILSAAQIEKMRVKTFDPYTVTALQGSGMQIQPSCFWVHCFKTLSSFLLALTQNYLLETNLCGPDFVPLRNTSKDHCLQTHWWGTKKAGPSSVYWWGKREALKCCWLPEYPVQLKWKCIHFTVDGKIWRVIMSLFWVMTLWRLVGKYRRIERTYSLNLRYCYLSVSLRGVKTQNIVILTDVRTSNLTWA